MFSSLFSSISPLLISPGCLFNPQTMRTIDSTVSKRVKIKSRCSEATPAVHPLQDYSGCSLAQLWHAGMMVSHQPLLTTALKKWIPLLPHGRVTEKQRGAISIQGLCPLNMTGSILECSRQTERTQQAQVSQVHWSELSQKPTSPSQIKGGKKTSQTRINAFHKDMWFGTVKEYRFIFRKIASN